MALTRREWLLGAGAAAGAAAQDFNELRIDRVAARQQFASGPVWSREGYLLFCDGPSDKLIKFVPGEGVATAREKSNGATGLAFDQRGSLYSCEGNGRRVIRQDKKGKVEVLAERWEGKRLNGPNDVTVSKNGHVYFTDPAFGRQIDTKELDFHGIFHINSKGEMEAAAKWKTRPNGIELSPNGKQLYVTNSDERSVHVFDIERDGTPVNDRTLISSIAGPPDGIRADEKGNLYVAAGALAVFSANGLPVHTVQLAEKPSGVCFGDADFMSVFVTARTSVFRFRINVPGAVHY